MDLISMQISGRENRFTVIERDNCVLIDGAFSPKWLTAIAQVLPKQAVMSPDLARMTGSNFAIGLPDDVDALIAKLKPAADAHAVQRHRDSGLSEAAARWLASGERGISSNTIFTHLTGFDALQGWTPGEPRDPADLRRCRLLLEQVPELVKEFPRMATATKAWAALVRDWDDICAAMDREIPNWRNPKRGDEAPQTYKLIKAATGSN